MRSDFKNQIKLGLHDAICLTDFLVFALYHCVNFGAMRCVSGEFEKIRSRPIAPCNSSIARRNLSATILFTLVVSYLAAFIYIRCVVSRCFKIRIVGSAQDFFDVVARYVL